MVRFLYKNKRQASVHVQIAVGIMNGRREGKPTPSEQEQVFILFINRRISLVIIFRTGGGGGGKILKLCAKDESFPHGRNRILEEKNAPENLVNKIYTSSPYTSPK